MFHKHANLLAVQGTTDIRIVCLVLTHKITCIMTRVRESILAVEMTLEMQLPAAGVAPFKQTSVRATMQGVKLHYVIQNAVTRCRLPGTNFSINICH